MSNFFVAPLLAVLQFPARSVVSPFTFRRENHAMSNRRIINETRYVVAHLVLCIMRVANRAGPGGFHLADGTIARTEHILIGLAVWIGQHEGKPMTRGKLALFLNIPRATIYKRIEELVAAGIMNIRSRGGVCFTQEWLNDATRENTAREFISLLSAAYRRVSRYDTLGDSAEKNSDR